MSLTSLSVSLQNDNLSQICHSIRKYLFSTTQDYEIHTKYQLQFKISFLSLQLRIIERKVDQLQFRE